MNKENIELIKEHLNLSQDLINKESKDIEDTKENKDVQEKLKKLQFNLEESQAILEELVK